MHRTDAPGATAGNLHTDGDPQTGTPPTQVDAAIMNALQEELAGYIESEGITLNKLDYTQLEQAINLMRARRTGTNPIDNGWFNFWQRVGALPATSLATAGSPAMLADRWVFDAGSGTASADVSGARLSYANMDNWVFELGAPTMLWPLTLSDVARVLRWDQTAATSATRAPALWQKIPGVGLYAGKQVTLSYVARLVSGSPTITPTITQWWGSSGATRVNYTDTADTLTSTFVRYSHTFTLGAYQTVGGIPYLQIKLGLLGEATFELELFDVRLDLGPFAMPVFQRSALEDLQRCMQFCQASWEPHDAPDTGATGYEVHAFGIHNTTPPSLLYGLGRRLSVPLIGAATTPTVTWYDDDGNADLVNKDDHGTTLAISSTTGASLTHTGTPTTTVAGDDASHQFWAQYLTECEFETDDRSA